MSSNDSNIIRKVSAEDLKKEMTQDDASMRPPLRNARILGPLILKHHTIKRPIEIRNCEFAGKVDLRYCEFEQVVNFSGCTFRGEFNSGDEIESHTVYKKDLICNDTTFDETAQFNGVRIEGSAYFNNAKFLNRQGALDFTGGSVEKSLECDNATFKGPANFRALKCNGYGSFESARFEKKADFALASFGGYGSFESAWFEKGADFYHSSFGSYGSFSGAMFEKEAAFGFSSFGPYVLCTETTFKGPVNFNSASAGSGFFSQAKFQLQSVGEITEEEGKVHATAVVGRTARELGVDLKTLEGKGTGPDGRITVGDVVDVIVKNNETDADFGHASFGVNVEFQGAIFERPVTFASLACGGSGFFCYTDDWVEFKAKKIDLSYASFGGGLLFGRATVEGEANFQELKCEGDGRLNNAQFDEKMDLSSTRFGSLSLEGARFRGEVDMSAAHISQDLTLGGPEAQFEKEVKLYGVSMEGLELKGTSLPFESGHLDLRRCQFNEVRCQFNESSDPDETAEELDPEELELELALEFAKAQKPGVFSRDPYLQLEESYNRIGDLVQAKRVYYEGRCDFRRHAKFQHQQPKAAKGLDRLYQWMRIKLTSWGDWLLKVLTGYGVRTHRLLPIFLVFVLFGFFAFSLSSNALKAPEPDPAAVLLAKPSGKTATPSSEEGGSESGKTRQAKDSKIEKAGFIDSVAYNVDVFLPVDLDVAAQWEPQGQLRETYVFVHALAGWLLIPLLITSLGGIIRRQ